jgi:hypothetical protein
MYAVFPGTSPVGTFITSFLADECCDSYELSIQIQGLG